MVEPTFRLMPNREAVISANERTEEDPVEILPESATASKRRRVMGS
jgi:hypothetical protein